MGYLTVKGTMMTYLEYKDYIEKYKMNGLKQFLHIFNAHKDRFIAKKDLHWGEELEFSVYYIDHHNEKIQLATQAFDLIDQFNTHNDPEMCLHPEFGSWMVEAVPASPHGSAEDLTDLLTCLPKLTKM